MRQLLGRVARNGAGEPEKISAADAGCSTGHALELRKVERLRPWQAALGEHFHRWLDQFGPVQAPQHHEDEAGEAPQIAGEQSGAAIGTEVAVELLAGFRDIAMRFRGTADQGEIILRHGEECGHLAARRSLAVQAMAIGDEVRGGVEFEFHGAAGALTRVSLRG